MRRKSGRSGEKLQRLNQEGHCKKMIYLSCKCNITLATAEDETEKEGDIDRDRKKKRET